MATLPADEDYARAILAIFHASHVRCGQTLKANLVQSEFAARNMGAQADYDAGLRYAIDHKWLRLDLSMLRFTEAARDEG